MFASYIVFPARLNIASPDGICKIVQNVITGNFTQSAGGTFEAEIGGLSPGIGGYDQLAVSGTATIDGTLTVSLFGGLQPAVGTTFDIMTAATRSGTFATTNLPLIFGGNCKGGPTYLPTAVRIQTYQRTVFTDQPDTQTICQPNPVTFSVVVDGSGPFTYQWRKNGMNILNANADSYTINATTPADNGPYDVVVTNICGSETSNAATLTVHVAPTISQPPQPATRCEGQSVMFSVTATGVPAPTYQWRKGGNDIGGAMSSSYTIASVTTTDEADYSVVVFNDCGSPITTPVHLTVNTAPVISMPPQPAMRCAVQGVTFTATASGTPGPSYQWRKGGVNINGATGSLYSIASTTVADSGNYSVVATNVCGMMESSAVALTVHATGTADLNLDTTVDGNDVQPFVGVLLMSPAGPASSAFCGADLNGDSQVNDVDVALMVGRLLS